MVELEGSDLVHHGAFDQSELLELRRETLRTVALGMIVVAVAYDLWLASISERIAPARWPLDLGLVGVAVTTLYLARRGVNLAGLVLSGGLTLLVVAATYVHPGYPIICGLSLLVALVTTLYGWRFGLCSAMGCTVLILTLQESLAVSVGLPVTHVALVLIWLGAFLGWLGKRPVELTLHWAWHSYEQERKAIDALRDRQAELVSLNRSLNDACERLEVANQELDRARRAAVRARVQRDRFAASVSHEMRTPLNLVIGFSEVMIESPEVYYGAKLPPSYHEDLNAIYRNACHLSQLVDDILDLAQIEADHLTLDKTWCPLHEVVDEAVLTTRGLFRTKGLELRVRLPSPLPAVLIDRTRIRQILINLLSNAARFTRVGGVAIDAAEEDHDIVISVRDTGSGIPHEYIQHIFEEFSQAVTPLHHQRGGTGLGLTISKRLAELHGGNLWAESESGQGSTFSFSLPKQQNIASSTHRPAWDSWVRPPDPNGYLPTVVALTDDPLCTRLLPRHLEGYRIVVAPSSADAERTPLTAHAVATIVLSTNTVMERRRLEQLGSLANLPTVSCIVDSSTIQTGQLGAVTHLTKPVTRARLRAQLRNLPPGPRSCLVVDDDAETTRMLTKMIRSLRPGWEVKAAWGGAEALDLLRSWRPGLMLLDLLMPDVDGYAVLHVLRSDERLREIPVVVVTGQNHDVERIVASRITFHPRPGLPAADLMRSVKIGLDLLTAPSRVAEPESSEAPAH